MQDCSELSLTMFWDCFVMVKNMLGGREKLNVILSNLLFRDKHNYLAGKISINAKQQLGWAVSETDWQWKHVFIRGD